MAYANGFEDELSIPFRYQKVHKEIWFILMER